MTVCSPPCPSSRHGNVGSRPPATVPIVVVAIAPRASSAAQIAPSLEGRRSTEIVSLDLRSPSLLVEVGSDSPVAPCFQVSVAREQKMCKCSSEPDQTSPNASAPSTSHVFISATRTSFCNRVASAEGKRTKDRHEKIVVKTLRKRCEAFSFYDAL
jgi:hypothetical protein